MILPMQPITKDTTAVRIFGAASLLFMAMMFFLLMSLALRTWEDACPGRSIPVIGQHVLVGDSIATVIGVSEPQGKVYISLAGETAKVYCFEYQEISSPSPLNMPDNK